MLYKGDFLYDLLLEILVVYQASLIFIVPLAAIIIM